MTSIEQEKKTIATMIGIYCRSNHQRETLSSECEELLNYALERIESCPFKEEKGFCSNCEVHCYQPEMRERIRIVMRFSGPRMLWHDPIMAIRHLISERREKRAKTRT